MPGRRTERKSTPSSQRSSPAAPAPVVAPATPSARPNTPRLTDHLNHLRAAGKFLTPEARATRLQQSVRTVREHALKKKFSTALHRRPYAALLRRAAQRVSQPEATIVELFVAYELRRFVQQGHALTDQQFITRGLAGIEPQLRYVHWCPSRRHLVLEKSKYGKSCSACRQPISKAKSMQALRVRTRHSEEVGTTDLGALLEQEHPLGWKLTRSWLKFPGKPKVPLRAGRLTRTLLVQTPALFPALEELLKKFPNKYPGLRRYVQAVTKDRGVTT